MSDADGEASETQVRLDFAKDCKYIEVQVHQKGYAEYKEVGKMLGSMIKNPKKFLPKNQ